MVLRISEPFDSFNVVQLIIKEDFLGKVNEHIYDEYLKPKLSPFANIKSVMLASTAIDVIIIIKLLL